MRNHLEELIQEIETLEPSNDPKAIDPRKLADLLRRESRRTFVEESRLRRYDRRLEYWVQSRLEVTRAVIAFGQSAIRTLLLANGAAAIAILAFLGQLLQTQPTIVRETAVALTIFSVGVACTSLVAAGAYLTQFFYDGSRGRISRWGIFFHIVSVVFGIVSIGMFVWGMMVSAKILTNI